MQEKINAGRIAMRVMLVDQIAKVNYKYTFPLANGLTKQGVCVQLIIDQKKERENCICERICLFNTSEKNCNKLNKLTNYVISYFSILKLIKRQKVDIIHSQWFIFSPVDYWFLRHIKKKYGMRYVATVHDILPFNRKFYDMYFHRKLYHMADSIILQAPGNVERFAKLFPHLTDKVHMIPHGHMLDYVEPQDMQESRQRLGIPSNKTVFLFFGQIKKVKGVDVLLKAIALLKGQYPGLYAVIAGSVWKTDFAECKKIIADNQLDKCLITDIRYIPDEEVKYYYSSCDVCVLPYTDVYQSGVIQLAYGYCKPVVATTLSAFLQFVKEDTTGFLAEPGNPESLAKAMEKAFHTDREKLINMGEAGYKLVCKELDWNNLAAQIVEKCYKNLSV